MRLRYVSFFISILFCFACNRNEKLKGYTRDTDGYYYKLIGLGDGNFSPERESILVFDAAMKTLSDSVFWDTKHDAPNGLYVDLSLLNFRGSSQKQFLKMVEGDSVSLMMKPAVFFRCYFDTVVPLFCSKDSLVKLDVKLNQIISRAEYLALIKNSQGEEVEEDTELEELKEIECYLSQDRKGISPDHNGIYTLERTHTTLEKVTPGKKIKLAYQGSFIDGRLIDPQQQTIEYVYGTPDQLIKGLNIVIGTLKKGETTKIIVPSRLAFGESGSSNGSIPPYTPLVYTLKIIDIK
jgi:FKBP-type peptidyl-prolyl cis-trans isomerase